MEASAIPASVGLARTRIAIGAPLLRLRSDEQLVSLFRSGSEEAFRAIHDRYRQRMFAYTRQMLSGSSSDAEDAVQEIFVRAYAGLRASDRQLALRAWLYRIAHNRCIDELRRPQLVACEPATTPVAGAISDPVLRLEQRDALRRLIEDVQRLPDQQRSALLMRELGGMTYADVSGALAVSVPAVKSLLVRARVGLAQASAARDTECARIREDLIISHDRGVRASGLARRHLRDCQGCRSFRSEVRGVSRQLAAFVPAMGPLGVIAKLLGIGGAGGGGAAAGGSAVASGGATAATGVAGTGAATSVGAIAGAGHVVTMLAAAVVTAGGAIELQHIAPPVPHRVHHHLIAPRASASPKYAASVAPSGSAGTAAPAPVTSQAAAAPAPSASTGAAPSPAASVPAAHSQGKAASSQPAPLPISETVDPDNLIYLLGAAASGNSTGSGSATPGGTSTPTTGTQSPGSAAPASPSPGSASPTPAAGALTPGAAGTGSTATTGAPNVSGGASTGSSGSGSSSSSGSTSSSSSSSTGGASAGAVATAKNGSTTTVTPATSTGSAKLSTPTKSQKTSKHAGPIAVFTMTGN